MYWIWIMEISKIFLSFQESDKITKTITFRPKTNHFFSGWNFCKILSISRQKKRINKYKSKFNLIYIIFMLIFHYFQWISLISCLFEWNWGISILLPFDNNFKWNFRSFSAVFDNILQISFSDKIELQSWSNKNFKMLHDQGFDHWDWILCCYYMSTFNPWSKFIWIMMKHL